MSHDPFAARVLLAVLATWFAVTAVCQPISGLAAHIRSWDLLNLIPAWTFFAPNPGMHDLHLLYRDRLAGGHLTQWKEVPMARPALPLLPLWCPGRRHNKALLDVMKHLALEVGVHRDSPNVLQLSLPYLAVLNFISRLPREGDVTLTQFLLMRSVGASSAAPEAVFLSSLHELEASA